MPASAERRTQFIDSHLHLADYEDPKPVLDFAEHNRITLLTNGIDEKTSMRGIELARAQGHRVHAFVGIHPSEAELSRDSDWLRVALASASGIGEIGLDPKYSQVDEGSSQMKLFDQQLLLAEKSRKPVQIHTRGAEERCLEILNSFSIRSVLLHWFQGESLSSKASDRGYYVSFGPGLLVSKKLQRIAASWQRDKVLTESDGPVSFAALGGAGGSWLVPSVAFRLATIFRTDFDATSRLLVDNTSSFLSSKP